MKSNWVEIKKCLSCCLHCGSFVRGPGYLCKPCEKSIEKFKGPHQGEVLGFSMKYLYDWSPQESEITSRLISFLKGPGNQAVWEYYSMEFAKTTSLNSDFRKKIIVPAPPGKFGKIDHAQSWGQALAKDVGAEILPCLIKTSHASQRGLQRGLRSLIELKVDEKYSKLIKDSSNCQWVFADDIVTTGATAHAAFIALGSPAHFDVWAFAHRRLSCGAPKHLI